MSNASKISNSSLLFAAIFVLALGLRFAQLGQIPFNEFEAINALNAFEFANGEALQAGAQSIYVILSGALFRLFASNEFLARFWPALLGSLFVLTPLALKKEIGIKNSLLFALGLALSPSLVAISRQAGSASIGLIAFAAMLLSWRNGKSIWTGISFSIILISGSTLIFGFLTLLISLLLPLLLAKSNELRIWRDEIWNDWKARINPKEAFMAFVISYAVGATMFLSQPQGIASFASSLAEFFQAVKIGQGIGASKLLLAFSAYVLPVFLFGLIAAFRSWKNGPTSNKFLLIWGLISLILLFLLPGRKAEDILWIFIPFLWLACFDLASYLSKPKEDMPAFLGTLFLLAVLSAFQVINFAALANSDPLTEIFQQRLLISAGVFLLAIIALALIAGGWSKDISLRSFYWTAAFIIAVMFFSQSARMGRDIFRSPNELWAVASSGGQTALLEVSLLELSDLNYGREYELEILVKGQAASLKWFFREWPKARFVSSVSSAEAPDIIINYAMDAPPAQPVAYRGQDFIWSSSLDWEGNWPQNIFAWFMFEDTAVAHQQIALWAREDLFPQNLDAFPEENFLDLEN